MTKIFLAALCLTFPVLIYADSSCKGKLSSLAVGRNGVVLAGGPGGLPSTYLCSLKEKRNNVEVEACQAIYSLLLASHAQKKEVNITFNPHSSCASVPSWNWATNFNWVIVQ